MIEATSLLATTSIATDPTILLSLSLNKRYAVPALTPFKTTDLVLLLSTVIVLLLSISTLLSEDSTVYLLYTESETSFPSASLILKYAVVRVVSSTAILFESLALSNDLPALSIFTANSLTAD